MRSFIATGYWNVAKKKKKTPCDLGNHKLFDTLGGDKLCSLGCGYREVGVAEDLKTEGLRKRSLMAAAEQGDDTELLAWLEEEDEV